MRKLALLLTLLLAVGCFAPMMAENEEFVPLMRYEDMEAFGFSWIPRDENGDPIRYSVSSEDMRYFAHYDIRGDLTSYEVTNEDFTITVEYDLFGNIIDIDMSDEKGVKHHYDMALGSWLLWNQVTSTYSIPDDTDLEINFDLLPAPLLVLEQEVAQ